MNFRYGIIGKNWAKKIYNILVKMNKNAAVIDILSPSNFNSENQFKENLFEEFKLLKNKFDIIWLAIPPKYQHFSTMLCLENNINIIIEKPWMYNLIDTIPLINIQKEKNIHVGFNFEYLYLDELINFDFTLLKNKITFFEGYFRLNSFNSNIKAEHNLGSHLIAIRNYYFKKSFISKFECNYKADNLRMFKIINGSNELLVDFTNNKQPIIQRLINDFENKLSQNKKFNINLEFASKIFETIYNEL